MRWLRPDGTIGPVDVVVTNANGISAPFQATLQAFSPAFFTFGSNNKYVAATLTDGTYVAPSGEFGTGLASSY